MLLLSLLIDWHASPAGIAQSCSTKIGAYQAKVQAIERSRAARTFTSTVLPLEKATASLRDGIGKEMFLSDACARDVHRAIEDATATPQLYAALIAARRAPTSNAIDRKLESVWLERMKRAGATLSDSARTDFLNRKAELDQAVATFDADPKNIPVFERILALRNRLAHLQGYESWADYALADRMAESPMRVEKFLRTSIDAITPAATAQEQSMRDHRRRRGEFDPQSVRKYFPREQTVATILDLFAELLNIKIAPVQGSDVWSPDVVTFEVSGAYLHLDLAPRAGKRARLVISTIVPSREVAVVGALPDDLTHDNVIALFHTIGQSISTLLAATPYESLNMFRDDFAEAPGLMFENFAWQPDVLKLLGLPDDVAAKLIATRTTSNAYDMNRELELALLDQQYHLAAHPHVTSDLSAAFDGTYYSEAWAHAYAADMFTAFSSGTVLAPAIGARFRQDILAPAGSLDPDLELSNFLGRPMNPDAFYKEFNP